MPNIDNTQQKANYKKELLSKLKPAELSNSKLNRSASTALLAVDVADAGVDEEALEKALQEFTRQTFQMLFQIDLEAIPMNDS